MARRRRGLRHSFKIPIITLAVLAGQAALANQQGGDALGKIARFGSFYTGIDFGGGGSLPGFVPANLIIGYGPWIVKRFVGAFARPKMMKGLPISLS